MKRLLLAVFLMAAFLPGHAGAVGVPGASANVELIAQLPDVQLMGGRIVGNLLYATGTAGLRIYDVSNPELPVPVGALPIEVFSNEDVSVSESRKLVLISNDQSGSGYGGALYVVDVANPAAPLIRGVLVYSTIGGINFDGVGHIANCINDCAIGANGKAYAYVTGADAGRIMIVDVTNPASPRFVKFFNSSAGGSRTGSSFKTVHDVYTDPAQPNSVWVTGTGGIVRVDVANPEVPAEKQKTTTVQNDTYNQFVFHNTMRKGNNLYITEEDWTNVNCDYATSSPNFRQEGSFQTWTVETNGLTPKDQWVTEAGQAGVFPVSTFCSAHWFDINVNNIVAIGWYQQGVRFLDVSNPSDIRQVGYYIPAWEVGGMGISHVLYHPARQDIAYAMSLTSGLVVLKLNNGGAKLGSVKAPIFKEWLQPPTEVTFGRFRPDPRFGFACAIVA